MKDCAFCQIVEGKIPCYKVYEDEDFLGFLDARPQSPGHCLIIPKKHYRWVDDVPDFGQYFEAAKKIGLAIKKTLSPRLVSYKTWGLDVSHAHIHVVPIFCGNERAENCKNIPDQKMRKIAERIRKRVK